MVSLIGIGGWRVAQGEREDIRFDGTLIDCRFLVVPEFLIRSVVFILDLGNSDIWGALWLH